MDAKQEELKPLVQSIVCRVCKQLECSSKPVSSWDRRDSAGAPPHELINPCYCAGQIHRQCMPYVFGFIENKCTTCKVGYATECFVNKPMVDGSPLAANGCASATLVPETEIVKRRTRQMFCIYILMSVVVIKSFILIFSTIGWTYGAIARDASIDNWISCFCWGVWIFSMICSMFIIAWLFKTLISATHPCILLLLIPMWSLYEQCILLILIFTTLLLPIATLAITLVCTKDLLDQQWNRVNHVVIRYCSRVG